MQTRSGKQTRGTNRVISSISGDISSHQKHSFEFIAPIPIPLGRLEIPDSANTTSPSVKAYAEVYNEDTGCTYLYDCGQRLPRSVPVQKLVRGGARTTNYRLADGITVLRPISQIKHTSDAIAGLRLGPRNDDDVTPDRGAQKTALDLHYRVFTNELIITQTTTK